MARIPLGLACRAVKGARLEEQVRAQITGRI